MIKALLKKQLLELIAPFCRERRTGKRRQGAALVAFGVLYIVLFGYMGFVFYLMADALCAPFAAAGMSWFYFSIMGLMSIVMGVVGSVFTAYASLYTPKDNDALLSMPIPTRYILITRLLGVFFMGLVFEAMVMIPTTVAFFMNVKVSAVGIIFTLLIPFVLSLLILSLSCILGFFVALIATRVKSKNFITVAVSLLFIVGYFFVYSKVYSLLGNLVADPTIVGDGVKNVLFLFYHMGLAAEGDVSSMLLFSGIIIGVMAVVFLILSRTFLSLATTNKGSGKYRSAAIKSGSIRAALFKRELRRFTGSANYMLNCGMGSLMTLVVTVFVIIKGGDLAKSLPMIPGFGGDMIALICAGALCMISSMNTVTAPSVSLEGQSLWIIRSLPVATRDALVAKLTLHLVLALPPMVILGTVISVVFSLKAVSAVLVILTGVLSVCFLALLGLAMNLKMPNLSWTSELVPIKQSAPVAIVMFGGWGIVMIFGGLYYLLRNTISPLLFLSIINGVFLAVNVFLYRWTVTAGARIFEKL